MLPAGDRDLVRDAARAERREREFAHFHRMVEEFVVVRGDVGAESVRRGAPARASVVATRQRAVAPSAAGAISTAHGASSRPTGMETREGPLKYPRVASRYAARTDRSNA